MGFDFEFADSDKVEHLDMAWYQSAEYRRVHRAASYSWFAHVVEVFDAAGVLDHDEEVVLLIPGEAPRRIVAARGQRVAPMLWTLLAPLSTPAIEQALYEEWPLADVPGGPEYERMRLAIESCQSVKENRVSYVKFWSSDHWLLTPNECEMLYQAVAVRLSREQVRVALMESRIEFSARYRQHVDPIDASDVAWVLDFVAWLRSAKPHWGVVVR